MSYLKRLALTLFIPLASALGALSSSALFFDRLSAFSTVGTQSMNLWYETLATGAALLLCSALLLWWSSGIVAALFFAAKARYQGRQNVLLPSWIPSIVKGLVTGLFGLGLLGSPSFAADPATLQPLSSVSTLEQSPAPEISPLLSSSRISAPAPQESAMTEIVTVQVNKHIPLSPFFGASNTAAVEDPGQEEPQAPGPQIPEPETYTVQKGDTLWSIAEGMLNPKATGAEVLALVYELQAANSEDIPTLEALIYPGQSIQIPQPHHKETP